MCRILQFFPKSTMDENISRWILEFFLHQQIDDRFLSKIFKFLPLPHADSDFKKCMLLRRIQSEIANNSISEKILGLIEEIEELHFRDGVMVPEEMKTAYCTVTVNCILKFVEDEQVYFEAVKKIWKNRVCKMMRAEMSGLVSEELKNWGVEIVEAAWDSSLRGKLLDKCKENDAEEAVRVYLAKAWEDLGPSFLEMVAETMADDKVREVLGLSNGLFEDCQPDSPSINETADKELEINPPEQTTAGYIGEVWVTDNDELEADESDKYAILQASKNNKIQETLQTSHMKLKDIKNNPLPNASNIADTVTSELGSDQEIGNAPHPSVDNDKNPISKPAGTLHGVRHTDNEELEVDTLVSETAKNQVNVDAPNPSVGSNNINLKRKLPQSLMEPNSTALTDKWDDSIDDLPEEGPSSENDKSESPSQKARNGSVSNNKFKNTLKRRKKRKWSTVEEDALRTYVQTHGKGNWMFILNMYRNIFEERTEVHLKDKWRNMMKFS